MKLSANPPRPRHEQRYASHYITIAAEQALTEGGGPDVPQRITFPLDIKFIDQSIFNTVVDTRFVALQVTDNHDNVVTASGFELTVPVAGCRQAR